ncbi:MAG: pyridoxine 5'-phosphate synthase [Pseudomonadota bacterium]
MREARERDLPTRVRLGVNIDHVATVRNARGGLHPDPVFAAEKAVEAGADGITAHLREDRRHISDEDITALMARLTVPLNLEMAATDEMLEIALRHRPHAACIVPERREELTTEGGLDAAGRANWLKRFVDKLQDRDIRVSLFIDAEVQQVEAAAQLGAQVIELHTGKLCDLRGDDEATRAARSDEFVRLRHMATLAHSLGLEVHAGHGLDYETAQMAASIPEVAELNIGHFLIGEAIFHGLSGSIDRMRAAIRVGEGARTPC